MGEDCESHAREIGTTTGSRKPCTDQAAETRGNVRLAEGQGRSATLPSGGRPGTISPGDLVIVLLRAGVQIVSRYERGWNPFEHHKVAA